MPTVNMTAPSSYQTEQADLERRRKLYDALQAQSMEPLQSTPTPAGGLAVPISPWQGLAKVAQALSAGYGQKQVGEEQKALAGRMRQEGQADISSVMAALKGTPAQSDNDPFGATEMPAVAGDRYRAISLALQSENPTAQGIGNTLLAAAVKPTEPYTLAPGAQRFGADNKPVASAPATPPRPQAKPEMLQLTEMLKGMQPDDPLRPMVESRIELLTTRPEKPETVSQLGRLIAERDALPPNAPGRAAYDQAISAIGRPPQTRITVGGGGKVPVGYRFSSDGETLEAIPGGPKDQSTAKPLPTAALRLQQAEVDAIGGAAAINADLATVADQVKTGALNLGLASNLVGQARNFVGVSNENSRNLATFRNTLERLRNESLRLNKGVQTEGDSVRAWNELFTNINDAGVVAKRLEEIQKTNARAIDLRKMNIDNIRKNYGAGPLDVSGQENQSSAIGGGAPSRQTPSMSFRTVQEAEAANLPKGTKITINGRAATVQ